MSFENPATPLLPAGALFESLGLGRSESGELVNEKQALRLATVYGCINVISQDLARLPLCVYQKMPDGTMREAPEHKLWPILHDAANENMTAMDFRKALLICVLLYGNGYAYIMRDRAARVVGLKVLKPEHMSPVLADDGELCYVWTGNQNGSPVRIPKELILHVRGFSFDGIVGMSPIGVCRETFGLAIASEKFGARFFGNGAKASGVFTHPLTLGTEAYENLKKSLHEMATGPNALRPILLEEGMKWEQMSIPPNDAQFLETRQFQQAQIAGAIFRVPLHMIGDLQRSTNNNIEHQGKEYVMFTLAPWAVSIEQQINRQLLKPPFYAEHVLNELSRGDFASQTAGIATLRQWGLYSIDDGLRDLRKNPIGGDEGNSRMVPVNMMPLERFLEAPEPTTDENAGDTEPPPGNPAAAVSVYFSRIWRDAVGRIVNRKPENRALCVRAVLTPVIESYTSALVGGRGVSELTDGERANVNGVINGLEQSAAGWASDEVRAIALRIEREIFEAVNL